MEFELRQRGRAAMDFMVGLGQASRPLAAVWGEDLTRSGITADTLPDDLDERRKVVDGALASSKAFGTSGLLMGFSSVEHGRVARAAFEESRDILEDRLAELETQGPATLEIDPAFEAPGYFKDVWFHRTTGGWDGHPQQGFIHGELIHRHYVAKSYPGDIFAQRAAVLGLLPRADYKQIVEMGTSSGHYTVALQRTFPDAHITGLDVSLPMIRQALRVANENGWAWDLKQRPGEDSGLPAASADLVTSYIIFHEMPEVGIRGFFEEAYRLLQPGGQVLMSDVIPYAVQDKLAVWRADWLARHGGEPYWSEAAGLDWAQIARDAGFVDVQAGGLLGTPYPWIVMGTKPHG